MPLVEAGIPADAPFTRENAEALLTFSELAELGFNYTSAVSLSGDDRKKLIYAALVRRDGGCGTDCGSCRRGDDGRWTCDDPPSVDAPARIDWLACPECGGAEPAVSACDACRGRGKHLLTECPRNAIAPGTGEVLRMFDFARGGNWPVERGILNQTAAFLDAYEMLDAIIPDTTRETIDLLKLMLRRR